MRGIMTKKVLAGFAGAAAIVGGVMTGAVTTAASASAYPCGGDQILNPEYGSDYGYHPRCVDTLQPNVPGAYGPDGYTPCVGDAASRRSPFCSDPGGSF
jgi:hypothetical protein